jgi:ankyrin repeat protein
MMTRILGFGVAALLSASGLFAASDVADAAMRGNKEAVRSLLQRKADVNAPQNDGTTALHWAAQANNIELADILLTAGAKASAANHDGATPMLLATINGNAPMVERLIKGGADPNASLTKAGNTPLMLASRTGKIDVVKLLLDRGAKVNSKETWGDTTALMWAVAEKHSDIAKLLVERGADVNARTKFVPNTTGRGFEGSAPVDAKPNQPPEEQSGGLMTALMFAAREGDLASARTLVAAGADINALTGDGKDALGLAVFSGNYDLASFLVDSHSKVDHPDVQGFTPLYWAVDRRNMETAPNFPWKFTADPLPLAKKLLEAGADPNKLINNTPRARMREGSPRVRFATVIQRAAFSGDLAIIKLLVAHGADPHIQSEDRETTLMAACGNGFISGYHKTSAPAERLEVVRLLIQLGEDVNAADNAGITPLMMAANFGDVPIVQYLIDKGADLDAHDLGKKNDGAFGASTEPLEALDYAIGVGTFRPNNAILQHEDVEKVLRKAMQEKGIEPTTSECTLRGFTCSSVNVDPFSAGPADIEKMRKMQIGNRVDGITGGLAVAEKDKEKAKDQK